MCLDDLQAGGEDLTALGAAGVLDHVVIYEPLPPAPDYKRSVQFSIYILDRDTGTGNLRRYWYRTKGAGSVLYLVHW
jgi:hypothetical protein